MDLGAELENALFTESNLTELCSNGLSLCKNLKVFRCVCTAVWVSLLSVQLGPNVEKLKQLKCKNTNVMNTVKKIIQELSGIN